MPRRRNVGTRAKASSGPQPSELTDPEPVPPCTVAPFPRDSARCVWALEGFRQRMFSCLSRADQVRAMTISKESYPQAVRARFHELDVWIYEDELPTITHPDRMWIFRQSVRHLNCSNFPLDLPDGSTLSRLLCTFPNVSQIVDDDGRICVLQGQGGRYTGVEVSEQCMVNSDCVTGATGHLVAPRWVPVDWEVTWSLSVMVQFKNSNRKLHKKLEHACQNRQGVWGHRIQTLSVNGLPRTAFTALFRALLQGPKSAPDTLAIFIDGYSYQDVQALGSITSGHVRTEGIIAPRDPDSTMVPELLDELDCSTFSGVEQFILVMGEQSFGPSHGFNLSDGSITATSALSQLHLRSFTLQVDSRLGSPPVYAQGQGTRPVFIPSKLARSLLAIGGPACLYAIAPGPRQHGDERLNHFYEDLTTFVRAEMAHFIEEQARRAGPGWWKSG